jgi:membrane-associated protease RseP (regulator of RpoE activity)
MSLCPACSTEILGPDKFCRNCGAAVVPNTGELVETSRFEQATREPAPTGSTQFDATHPFYVPPSAAYAVPAPPTRELRRLILNSRVAWLTTILFLGLVLAAVVGIIAVNSHRQHVEDDQAQEAELSRHLFDETVQNALGLKVGEFPESEFQGVQGVFVNSLMSDNSPAAQAGVQAGDLVTDLNGQPVKDNETLGHILDSLKPGDEVGLKLYRDGKTVEARIHVADRSFAPFMPKIEERDQGYLGVREAVRRCCVPGTQRWGLEIREIADNSPVDLAALQPGDVITDFDGRPVRTTSELNRRIRAVKPREKVKIRFYRGSDEKTTEMIIGHRW